MPVSRAIREELRGLRRPRTGDPYEHRRAEPRPLAFAWLLYMLAAMVVTLGAVGVMGLLASEVVRPAARVLFCLLAAGSVVLWPMMRLSQEAPERGPVRACAADFLALVVAMQATLWPLIPLTGWSWRVVGAVAAMLGAWVFVSGGVLVIALRACAAAGEVRRGAWTGVFVVLLLGGLLVAPWLGRGDEADVRWMLSPLSGVFELTRDRFHTGKAAEVSRGHWEAVWWIAGAGAAVWVLAVVGGGWSIGSRRDRTVGGGIASHVESGSAGQRVVNAAVRPPGSSSPESAADMEVL